VTIPNEALGYVRSDKSGAPGHQAVLRSHGGSPFNRLGLPAALVLIGIVTLVPLGSAPPTFAWKFSLSDLLINLALFFPLGLFRSRGSPPWRILGLALAVSATIELLQGALIPGRRGSVLDLASNLAGAAAGILWWEIPAALLVLPAMAWLGSGLLLAPSPPRTPTWWGQWAHHFTGTVPFEGRILAVRLGGLEVPDGSIPETPALFREVDRDGPRLELELIGGPATAGKSHVAGVADGTGHPVIAVEQFGPDLLLTWHSLGASLGLRTPTMAFSGLAPPPGSRATLQARVTRGGTVLRLMAPGLDLDRRRGHYPWTGWRSLVGAPGSTPAGERLVTLAWSGAFVGYLVLLLLRLRPPP
jgi:hypothetical protein